MRDTLWFTSTDEIAAAGAIAQPIWWRGRDARRWLDDFEVFAGTVGAGSNRKSVEARRQYVAQQLAATDKAYLLPPDYTKSSAGSS